jgi:Flp pilus assembly protein TadD
MTNVCLAIRLSVTVFISCFAGSVAAQGQRFPGSSYQIPYGNSPWEVLDFRDSAPSPPQARQLAPSGPSVISTDVLRHPLTSKASRLLQKAIHNADHGNHLAAIQDLREMLAKDPLSAAYADNLLGMEYIEIYQFANAKDFFQNAVRLMPNESINHANLGFSLAITGEWDSAESEVLKALQLDPANAKARSILDIVLMRKRQR